MRIVIASLVRALTDAGMDGHQIAAILEQSVVNDFEMPPQLTADRKRDRDRQRIATKRDNERQSRDMSDNGDKTLPPGSKQESSSKPLQRTQLPSPNQTPPIIPLRPTRRSAKVEALRDFDRWYSVYPRKVAKGAAERAFPKAVNLASVDSLIAATVAYVASRPDPQFIPHPASWLNAKRWLDQPDKPPDEPGKRLFDLSDFEARRAASRGTT